MFINSHKSMRTLTLLTFLAVGVLLIVSGCSRPQTSAQSGSIMIKGSDTMVNLMSNMAEAFMREHKHINVAVTGGGSGTGIAALINGTTQLCASSRKMNAKEMQQARAQNVLPIEHAIGLDGLAVMVNPSNSVSELSLEQLRKIYTGEYTNWRDVGGPTQEIVLLSRESNSGTYVYFQEHVLNKQDYSPKARLLPSTAAVVQSVSADLGAIGYGGLAYAENPGVKMVKVKTDADTPGVTPTMENVLNGSYPISRPLFLYTNGQPAGATQEFVSYAAGPQGQAIVEQTGYIPLKK